MKNALIFKQYPRAYKINKSISQEVNLCTEMSNLVQDLNIWPMQSESCNLSKGKIIAHSERPHFIDIENLQRIFEEGSKSFFNYKQHSSRAQKIYETKVCKNTRKYHWAELYKDFTLTDIFEVCRVLVPSTNCAFIFTYISSYLYLQILCRYEPFIVAETSMPSSSNSKPTGEGGQAFNTLAGYLFGKNKSSEKMNMTTPVFTDSEGKMQFVLKARKVKLYCYYNAQFPNRNPKFSHKEFLWFLSRLTVAHEKTLSYELVRH